uniref:Uncharacterized protein n=1 Tax=Octactis speculum TaxID=3111310 RepID=A0A7S2E2Z9_9STRA|mmetsp:Transcript_57927/g.78958  ORF Transcript_57927/g.78958 Transcript_57927/m.78958 type:complete len:126 (+) Transcript_57927:39-416(+)
MSAEDFIQYRRLIFTTLEPLLKDLRAQRDALDAAVSGCQELCQIIGDLQADTSNSPPRLETLVDIGQNCFVEAIISDASRLVVDMGAYGVHVELTISEAKPFLVARSTLLQRFGIDDIDGNHLGF